MAPSWTLFLLVIFAFLRIGHSLKPVCPNNRIYQCVPSAYCSEKSISRTYYRCSDRYEVCCEEKKVFYGVRFTGSHYIQGPYNQGY